MTRLHTKLMLAFSLVVVFIVSVMLASLWKVAAGTFADHLRTDMARSYLPFENLQKPLLKQLVDRTSQIASDPTLQEARIRHDSGNLKDLIEEMARGSRLDLFALTDDKGKVLVE